MVSIWVVIIVIFVLGGMVFHQWFRYMRIRECYKCVEFYLVKYIEKYGQSDFDICEKVTDGSNSEK